MAGWRINARSAPDGTHPSGKFRPHCGTCQKIVNQVGASTCCKTWAAGLMGCAIDARPRQTKQ
jgi:hypothetical protein